MNSCEQQAMHLWTQHRVILPRYQCSKVRRPVSASLLTSGGHGRVADMGLARWLTPESMGVLTGETGTYLYMSPEMIRHELYNSATDVFSWGVLLVEVVSQKIPYEDHHLTPLQVSMQESPKFIHDGSSNF